MTLRHYVDDLILETTGNDMCSYVKLLYGLNYCWCVGYNLGPFPPPPGGGDSGYKSSFLSFTIEDTILPMLFCRWEIEY